jgi:hypothetical protein
VSGVRVPPPASVKPLQTAGILSDPIKLAASIGTEWVPKRHTARIDGSGIESRPGLMRKPCVARLCWRANRGRARSATVRHPTAGRRTWCVRDAAHWRPNVSARPGRSPHERIARSFEACRRLELPGVLAARPCALVRKAAPKRSAVAFCGTLGSKSPRGTSAGSSGRCSRMSL